MNQPKSLDKEQEKQKLSDMFDYLFSYTEMNNEIYDTLLKYDMLEYVEIFLKEKFPTISHLPQKLPKIDVSIRENEGYYTDLVQLSYQFYANLGEKVERVIDLPAESGMYKFIVTGGRQLGYNPESLDSGRKKILGNTGLMSNKLIFRADNSEYHEGIRSNIDTHEAMIFGGGRVNINHEDKKIKIYGYSSDYGKVGDIVGQWMIQELRRQYSNYEIDVALGEGY